MPTLDKVYTEKSAIVLLTIPTEDWPFEHYEKINFAAAQLVMGWEAHTPEIGFGDLELVWKDEPEMGKMMYEGCKDHPMEWFTKETNKWDGRISTHYRVDQAIEDDVIWDPCMNHKHAQELIEALDDDAQFCYLDYLTDELVHTGIVPSNHEFNHHLVLHLIKATALQKTRAAIFACLKR